MSKSVVPRLRYRQNNKNSETNFKHSPRMLSFALTLGTHGAAVNLCFDSCDQTDLKSVGLKPTESWLIQKEISVLERHLGLGSHAKEVIDITLYTYQTRIKDVTASFKFTFSTHPAGLPSQALSLQLVL